MTEVGFGHSVISIMLNMVHKERKKMMIIVYIVFTVLFWNMCNIAEQEGRVGWAWVYLILSALNGSMAIAAVF